MGLIAWLSLWADKRALVRCGKVAAAFEALLDRDYDQAVVIADTVWSIIPKLFKTSSTGCLEQLLEARQKIEGIGPAKGRGIARRLRNEASKRGRAKRVTAKALILLACWIELESVVLRRQDWAYGWNGIGQRYRFLMMDLHRLAAPRDYSLNAAE